jgi:hypothetical protein
MLDPSTVYEGDQPGVTDNHILGLTAGYMVSAAYSQESSFSGVGTEPTTSVSGFLIYDGGVPGSSSETEYWNELEIMLKEDQLWLWWNGLLIPPDTTLCAELATPVTISTPYFPITRETVLGKFGLRLWPGALVRRVQVRAQCRSFSPFSNGQLELG